MNEDNYEIYEIAVIGGGAAGTMAYLRSVLNNDRAAMFTGNVKTKRKGRALWVSEIDNIPGMQNIKNPVTAANNVTLKWLESQEHLKEKGTLFRFTVSRVEKAGNLFRVYYTDKNDNELFITAKYVIIATGVMDIQPEINGSIKAILPFANIGDAIYCVRCDGHKTIGHRLSVIGYQDSAIGLAMLMQERYGHQEVSVFTNKLPEQFSEKKLKLAGENNIRIYREAIINLIPDPESGHLKAVELESGIRVETTKTIVSLGTIVYNGLLKQLEAELDDSGRVITGKNYETSVPGIFAVGDLVSGKKMQIYTGWDQAVDAADEINHRLRVERRSNKKALAA